MYGYVRPLKGELKVREYESFKAAYCGLCHRLKARYGFAARFVVNFDFTYMAMLLSEPGVGKLSYCRCAASPLRKKCCHCEDPALDRAADYSVILAYWKLRDSVADDSFGKRLKSRIALIFLRRAYKTAQRNAYNFDLWAQRYLAQLHILEQDKSASLDAVADCFARILEFVSPCLEDDPKSRILSQIFYHTGRIIYILDAVDDLPEDVISGRYNPLIYRFGLRDGQVTAEARQEIELTLQLSENVLRSSFELLPESQWTSILENIIYMGFPWVMQLVLDGKWREIRKIRKEKMNGAEL